MTKARTTTLGERLLSEAARWPVSWESVAEDIPLGRDLVKVMLPFLRALVASSAAPTTLRRHFGNAWVLGGYIVRDVSLDRPAQRAPALELVLEAVEEDGGPLITDLVTEEEQRSFDSTCRLLSRFLRKRRSRGAVRHCPTVPGAQRIDTATQRTSGGRGSTREISWAANKALQPTSRSKAKKTRSPRTARAERRTLITPRSDRAYRSPHFSFCLSTSK